MRYDPNTIWSAVWTWFQGQPEREDEVAATYRPAYARISLAIYVRGEPEPYHLHNPKLYRATTTSGLGPWVNCDQDELKVRADELGHVVLHDRGVGDTKLWPTWAAFAHEVGIDKL